MPSGHRTTIEEVEKLVESRSYKIVEINRENFRVRDPIVLRCQKGHLWKTNYHRFKTGAICLKCSYEQRGKNKWKPWEDVVKIIEHSSQNYTVISKESEYKGGDNTILTLKCPNDHIVKKSYKDFLQHKHNCSKCWNKGLSEKNEIWQSAHNKQQRMAGIEILSYKNAHDYLICKCSSGHEYKQHLSNFKIGNGCPVCNLSSSRSFGETNLLEFIEANYDGEIVCNSRKIIAPKEIDVYLPELKLGFEYHGLYWHSNANKHLKNYRNYHLEKFELSQTAGIKLIQIFEDEWRDKKEICQSRIMNMLGKSEKVGARECEFKEINRTDANYFNEQHHIQGKGSGCNRAFGLFHVGALVSVMTFSKTNIAKGSAKYDWELNRFCSRKKLTVIGSASKLLKNSGLTNIISYCDLRWSNGDLYLKLGFEEKQQSIPNYWWVVAGKRKHRFVYRKNVLFDMLENNENWKYEDITESELAKLLGMNKVYDVGNKVFTFS